MAMPAFAAAASPRAAGRPGPGSTHTHTRFSGTTQVSRYQKGKTNVDFIEARDNNNNDRLTAFDPGQPG